MFYNILLQHRGSFPVLIPPDIDITPMDSAILERTTLVTLADHPIDHDAYASLGSASKYNSEMTIWSVVNDHHWQNTSF